MFKDCKTGGYNLESTYAQGQRLMALILLIAIAYTCSVLVGHKLRQIALHKYLGRLQELKRSHRRHSTFWIGLYGYLWIGAMEFWADFAHELMQLKPHSSIFSKVYVL
jgi:hypothetical protein